MSSPTITGVILAGGRASRLGGVDKGLITLAGKPLVEHVILRLAPQVETLVINANRHLADYAAYGFPVVEDSSKDYLGPLAGILSALRFVETDYILTVPCDLPFIPMNLCERLLNSFEEEKVELCAAHDGVQIQPLVTLLSCKMEKSIATYLEQGGRKVEMWVREQYFSVADFSDCPGDFVNINTPEDLAAAGKV